MRSLVGLVSAALLIRAVTACARPPAPGVDLAPRDQRPVYAVTVDDPAEAALLIQQLSLERIRVEGATLYFIGSPAVLERLRATGYSPMLADRMQVERRVVRVFRRGNERDVIETGVRLLNREDGYWVVDGSLRELQLLSRLGYRIGAVGPNEPRPREIRITVRSRDDVQRVSELNVDIYNVRETAQGIVIAGGAYDVQIDALRAAGYQVERVSTVTR